MNAQKVTTEAPPLERRSFLGAIAAMIAGAIGAVFSIAAGRFATEFPGLEHADFVVGDRDGTTASPALSALICDHLRACGYSVEYNHPYKGVELVRRYGNPAQHRHSVQVEINRKLYMDERTLAQVPEGMARLQADLQALVRRLLAHDPR